MQQRQPCVYIMTNEKRTLYTGVTSNLLDRVWQHRYMTRPQGFAHQHACTKLVYYAEFSRMDDAIAFEKYVKGKVRSFKINLIEEMNPEWQDLAEHWYD